MKTSVLARNGRKLAWHENTKYSSCDVKSNIICSNSLYRPLSSVPKVRGISADKGAGSLQVTFSDHPPRPSRNRNPAVRHRINSPPPDFRNGAALRLDQDGVSRYSSRFAEDRRGSRASV